MLSVVDKDSGDSINAAEGNYEHLIVMLGILASRCVDNNKGTTIDYVAKDIKMAIEAALEVDQEENEVTK